MGHDGYAFQMMDASVGGHDNIAGFDPCRESFATDTFSSQNAK